MTDDAKWRRHLKQKYMKTKNSLKKTSKLIAEAWQRKGRTRDYRRAASKAVTNRVDRMIAEDVLDGVPLSLGVARNGATAGVQRRVLRRIVEKRQAQAICRVWGNNAGLFGERLTRRRTGRCISELQRHCNGMTVRMVPKNV